MAKRTPLEKTQDELATAKASLAKHNEAIKGLEKKVKRLEREVEWLRSRPSDEDEDHTSPESEVDETRVLA